MKPVIPFLEPVYITQPLLPNLTEVNILLEEIWNSGQLTNSGPMSVRLEKKLAKFLKANYLSVFCNGTIALQIACKVLRLTGEVITTPFTFPATPHALAWNNLKPVFCDIKKENFNIDPDCIEALITPETSAIMPVHVFGQPCDVKKIEDIAAKYNLKVIYDAAHAFGVEIDAKPISTFGDISMFSFHATKIFHTIEGGALTFNNPHLKERADILRNFGITGAGSVYETGINGKLNEIQAAVGTLVLELVNAEIKKRKKITSLYRKLLKNTPGITVSSDVEGVIHNYPYFVIRVNREGFGLSRDGLFEELKKYNVFCRKYFFPLCSEFLCYKNKALPGRYSLPIAEKAAQQVLALPLYGNLSYKQVEHICEIINSLSKHFN